MDNTPMSKAGEKCMCVTFSFGCLIVGLADELAVLHEVELVPRVELAAAHDAGEALQMVHVVLGAAHHLGWGNPLVAARALGPVPPGAPTATRTAHYCNSPFLTYVTTLS